MLHSLQSALHELRRASRHRRTLHPCARALATPRKTRNHTCATPVAMRKCPCSWARCATSCRHCLFSLHRCTHWQETAATGVPHTFWCSCACMTWNCVWILCCGCCALTFCLTLTVAWRVCWRYVLLRTFVYLPFLPLGAFGALGFFEPFLPEPVGVLSPKLTLVLLLPPPPAPNAL